MQPGQAVSQLFPLAARAEHLALLRQDTALGPGLASSETRAQSSTCLRWSEISVIILTPSSIFISW